MGQNIKGTFGQSELSKIIVWVQCGLPQHKTGNQELIRSVF